MADDKTKQPPSDRARVAAGQDSEVAYFARTHGISASETRDLIADVGNDREALQAAVKARPAAKRKPRSTSVKKPADKAATVKAPDPRAAAAKTSSRRSRDTNAAQPRNQARSSSGLTSARRSVSATAGRGVKATRRLATTAQGLITDLPTQARRKTRAAVTRAPSISPIAAMSVAGVAIAGFFVGLFLMRGRSIAPQRKAHRADGQDDSASFDARIADEGTIPDVTPEG